MESQRKEKPVFGIHIPWKHVREKLCRTVSFTPFAKVKDGKVLMSNRTLPYGFLTVECEGLSGEAEIWVTHRIDFLHLWQAFNQRDETKGEEVIVIPLPRKLRIFSNVFPKLRVWLCPRGAFNKMLHRELQEKKGMQGYVEEIAPIAEWEEDSV